MAVAAAANFTVAALLTPPRAADQQAMQQHHNTTQTTTTAANKQLQLLLVAVVALLVFCGFHFFSYFHLFYLQFWTFLAAPHLFARPRPRESVTRRAHFICYCCFIYLLPCLTVFVCLWLCFGLCEQCNDLELRLLCIFFSVVVVLFLHSPAGIYYWSGLVGQPSWRGW